MKQNSLTTTFVITLALLLITVGCGVTAAVAQKGDRVVAVVNGSAITERQLDNSLVAQLLPLEQQIYAIRKAALEHLVVRAILEGEARRQGISLEELGRHLTSGKVEVSPSQVEQLYAENLGVFGAMSPDEAKQRLRLDLENQARMQQYRAALAKLRVASTVEINLEEPKVSTAHVRGKAPSRGAKDALVTIVEFADFQCAYCREIQDVIKRLMNDYPNEVTLVFKYFPLDIHSEALSSAKAAFCAGEQQSFWQYHDALFASQAWSPEAFNKIALDLTLSVPKFSACLNSEASQTAVLEDKREGLRVGINSTPTFIVNGKLVRGAIGFEEFKTIIERELKSARNPSRTKEP